jgi:transposase
VPRKNESLTPQRKIDEFIKRHLEGGEGVRPLAKAYKISVATGYLWLQRHRQKMLDKSFAAEMSPAALEKVAKSALVAELRALKLENAKLRNKIVSLMIKAGDL